VVSASAAALRMRRTKASATWQRCSAAVLRLATVLKAVS
jgi:hypothetical protein